MKITARGSEWFDLCQMLCIRNGGVWNLDTDVDSRKTAILPTGLARSVLFCFALFCFNNSLDLVLLSVAGELQRSLPIEFCVIRPSALFYYYFIDH